jgi:hypothetical protein
MKVGDLVKFESNFFSAAAKGYANPGIILEDVSRPHHRCARHFRVMWADQRVTTEHTSYLEPLTSP